MQVEEIKNTSKGKRQGETIFDVLFSSFKSDNLSIVDVLPYKRPTDEGFVVDRNDEYQAYLKVKTSDLVSMNNSDLKRTISQLTTLCRIYTEPTKILSMTYLTETNEQQRFWKSRINKYRRAVASNQLSEGDRVRYETMLKLAMDNLRRVTWVEENLTELTFFIIVYGKDSKELKTNIRDMKRYGGKLFDLRQVDKDSLEDIIFRLNNMNTEL